MADAASAASSSAANAANDDLDITDDFIASIGADALVPGSDDLPIDGGGDAVFPPDDDGGSGGEEEDDDSMRPGDDDDDNQSSGGQDDDEDEGEAEQTDEERAAEMERARQVLLARGFRPRHAPRPPVRLSSFDLRGVAEFIATTPCTNIVVMCGAGISVSAGIPDFRSPGTGLYDNLQKYDLPSPQSIFELSYFREKPDAFYRLCAELWPDNFAPTPTHHFLKELHDRGVLRRCFTQNIDSLEKMAHLPAEKIVAAHGNFDRCSCIETGESVAVDEVRAAIVHGREGPEGWSAMGERYGGLVKPDIVFFGEQLPERFFQLAEVDLAECDLLIILGTSLKVQPFASLVGLVKEDVPRLLINREQVCTRSQPTLTPTPTLTLTSNHAAGPAAYPSVSGGHRCAAHPPDARLCG